MVFYQDSNLAWIDLKGQIKVQRQLSIFPRRCSLMFLTPYQNSHFDEVDNILKENVYNFSAKIMRKKILHA
jgi:hypothetical protein